MTNTETFTVTTPSDREIVVTRVFNAPRKLVFDAWTNPKYLPHWMLGPDGWFMPVCEIDLRPGGSWHIVWRHSNGQEMEMRELVTVRQFRDLPEALLAKGSLESAGIECFLADENLVRLDWFISNFIGGIKLNVHAADVHDAQKLLDEPILEGLYVQGVGLYEQPRCPKCNSLDVNFQELDRPIAYMSAFLRVPIPVQRPAWRCHGCNAEWEDDVT